MAHVSSVTRANGLAMTAVVVLLGGTLVGCQSHLNSQLLERELRLQEDQIYRLQDVLDEKCARLESVVAENASLKRQLGYGASEPVRSRAGSSSPTRAAGSGGSAPPAFVPPTVELADPAAPGVLPAPGSTPGPAGPPVLEGVPPLPQGDPAPSSGEGGGDAPPAFGLVPEVTVPAEEVDQAPGFTSDPLEADVDDGPSFAPTFVAPQAAAPGLLNEVAEQASAIQSAAAQRIGGTIQPLSYEVEEGTDPEPAAVPLAPAPTDAIVGRIVINREETRAVDTDGNGAADALAVVFEPRDLNERLIGVRGDVVITVEEASAREGAAAVASWTIPAADAAETFRSTSRSRGLRFFLPWQGVPRGFVGTVHVQLRAADGVFTAETPLSCP